MELGEKLRQARLDAGLSQRQLCGEYITRNMLSLIENGTARPSMTTLQYLAGRLGKSVGFFLEEEIPSENQSLMAHARRASQEGNWAEVRLVLEGFRQPDDVFEWEYHYLTAQAGLETSREAMKKGKTVYARQILEDLIISERFPDLNRQRLLLLGQIKQTGLPELCVQLPDLEEELFFRGKAALEEKNFDRGLCLLSAMEKRSGPEWHLLQGQLLMGKKQYDLAAESLLIAEDAFPDRVCPLLEECYRELGDFRKAYAYACKQR